MQLLELHGVAKRKASFDAKETTSLQCSGALAG
jgi:hypothetical protein